MQLRRNVGRLSRSCSRYRQMLAAPATRAQLPSEVSSIQMQLRRTDEKEPAETDELFLDELLNALGALIEDSSKSIVVGLEGIEPSTKWL